MIRQLILLFMTLAAFLPAFASDADLQQQLSGVCKDSIFVLRQPDASKDIEFDSQGNRLGTPKPAYWFENAAFRCSKVAAKNGDVRFEGQRLVLEYDVSQKDFVPRLLGKKVRVMIKNPGESAQLTAVLRKLFLAKDENVRDAAPDYWQRFLHPELRDAVRAEYKLPKDEPKVRVVPNQTPNKPDGTTPPKALYDPDPRYPKLAQKENKQAVSVLWVVIDRNGSPTAVTVVRPAGNGFDDMAAEAVKGWKFQPATKEGFPVPVQVKIEVNFRLY